MDVSVSISAVQCNKHICGQLGSESEGSLPKGPARQSVLFSLRVTIRGALPFYPQFFRCDLFRMFFSEGRHNPIFCNVRCADCVGLRVCECIMYVLVKEGYDGNMSHG